MAQFKNSTLTYAGIRMITQSHAIDDRLRFTRLAIGDFAFDPSKPDPDPADKSRPALEHERMSVAVADIEIRQDDGVAILTGHLDNKTINKGDAFRITEIGAFACNADGAEKLYAYAWVPLSRADLLPDKTTPVIGTDVKVVIAVSDAANIVANIDISYLLTDAQLKALTDNYALQLDDAKAWFRGRVADEYGRAQDVVNDATASLGLAVSGAEAARDAALAAQAAAESAEALVAQSRDDAQSAANDAAAFAAAAQSSGNGMDDVRDEVMSLASRAATSDASARYAANQAVTNAQEAQNAELRINAGNAKLLADMADVQSGLAAAHAAYADLRRQLNSVGITTWEERAVAVEVGDWTALDPTDTDNEDDIEEGFNYAATVSLPGVLPSQRPIEVRAERDSEAAVASAGRMAVDTQADEVRVLAASLPAGDISLTFVLLGTKIWPEPKLPANLSFDKTELTLAVGATDTITVTRDGDGAVDAWSDDDSVMAATISGATVTVTGVAVGNATVRASVDETDTHLDDTAVVAVTVTA